MSDFEIRACGSQDSVQAHDSQVSADRIADALQLVMGECTKFTRCDLQLNLENYETAKEKAIISGSLTGMVNGLPFAKQFESHYDNTRHRESKTLLQSPVFGLMMMLFSRWYYEQDAPKNASQQLARAEFWVVTCLEESLKHFIGAPQSRVRRTWRRANRHAILSASLLAPISIWLQFKHVGVIDADATFIERLAGAAMFGLIFVLPCALIAFAATLLTLPPSSLEFEVAGQSLLRLVGVKSVSGFRIVCWVALFLGFGLAVGGFGLTLHRILS